jgi:PAS domain S-box-containing protein
MAAIQTANYVRDTHQASLLLAQRADVRQAIEHKDWFPLEASLRQWATMNPHSDGVFLFSPDGGLLADGIGRGPNNSTRVAERDWFQAVLTTGQPSMGEPTASRGTGHAVVPLGIPVYDSHGSLQGIMVTSIALEALSEMLDSVHVDGETQATLIDLDRGLVLADPAQRQLITPNSVVDNARAQLGSDRGVLSTSLDGGTPVLAAMAPVPGLHWAVLVYEPTSTAFAPLAGMIGKTIGLTVLALVLAGACALMLVLWITAPIEQLRTAAMAMADGDLSRRARLDRRDEIGDLGMAFDAMADRLASTVRRLEEDVEARGRIEQELREGQQRLRAFFDAAPIGINVLDANARTIQANRALQDMIGYSEDELLGRTFSDYSDPDEQARDALAIREMRAGGREEVVRRENLSAQERRQGVGPDHRVDAARRARPATVLRVHDREPERP